MKIMYRAMGDQGLLMEFENKISPEISRQIRSIMDKLEEKEFYKDLGIRELIPTYRSILVLFDPFIVDIGSLEKRLVEIVASIDIKEETNKRIIIIPTLYGGDMGPDLAYVAKRAGMSEEEVINIHRKPDYLVYMLGFTPGFTYLGGLDPKIATPRLESSRLKIPAGSVGIADQQTGIYPIDSPGGWQLIGRTPVELMVEENDPPVLVRAGDYIRFRKICIDEFVEIKKLVEKSIYKVEIIEEGGED